MQHRYASVHLSACPTVHAHARQLRRTAWLRSRDLQHFAQLVTRINTTICTWLSAHTIAHRNGFGPALTLCKAACGSCMCWQQLQALSVKIKLSKDQTQGMHSHRHVLQQLCGAGAHAAVCRTAWAHAAMPQHHQKCKCHKQYM